MLLSHALFVLNFLTLDMSGRSAADRFWPPKTSSSYAQVLWKDPLTGMWNGPDPFIIWAKGSACIYNTKEGGVRWLPERLIKPYNKFQAEKCLRKKYFLLQEEVSDRDHDEPDDPGLDTISVPLREDY